MAEPGFLTGLLAATLQAGTPLLLAALGELLAERAGVLNLGVEGMMLVGAMVGFSVDLATGSAALGCLAAAGAAGLLALGHAFLTVGLRANQVVTGLGLTVLGLGLSGFFGAARAGQRSLGLAPLPLPGLADLPGLGPVLFHHDALVYLALALVPATWWYLYRTRPGLILRACGENPRAADAWGEPVILSRYVHVVLGGLLAGLGGAYLSLGQTHMWTENMVAGRGWIALALVVFGFWQPFKVATGAVLFGGLGILQLRLQAAGTTLPPSLLGMLPYLLTVAALVALTLRQRRTGRTEGPAALGQPFIPIGDQSHPWL
jgi:simple sugar transport system permease protein